MAAITLGNLRDLWKNVSDWVKGVDTVSAPKVTLAGRNVEFVKTYFSSQVILDTNLLAPPANIVPAATLAPYKELILVVNCSLKDGTNTPVVTQVSPFAAGNTGMPAAYKMTVTEGFGSYQLFGKLDSKALALAGVTDLNFGVQCTTAPTQGNITVSLYGVKN